MKKISGLLALAFVASSGLSATNDTKKTEAVLRPIKLTSASLTAFHNLKKTDDEEDITSAKIQAIGFYNATCSSSKLGRLFGANGENTIKIGTPAESLAGTVDVENNLILHSSTAGTNALKGTMKFNPKRTAFGSQINSRFNLNKFFKGLYLENKVTCLHVRNDVKMTVSGETVGAYSGESIGVKDLFNGSILTRIDDSGVTDQRPLKYAKIKGPHSVCGLGNIETTLGFRFPHDQKYVFGINAKLQTPSGFKPTGEWLWEPRLGSVHWGLGCGLEGEFVFAEKEARDCS